MATTPPTFSSAAVLASSDLNLLRDAILELQARADGTDYYLTQLTRSTDQAIPDSSDELISWSSQVIDIGNGWTSGTDFTVPAAWIPAGATTIGIRVSLRVRYDTNATGKRKVQALYDGSVFASVTIPALDDDNTDVFIPLEVAPACEAGKVLTFLTRQSSGTTIDMNFALVTIERAGVTG